MEKFEIIPGIGIGCLRFTDSIDLLISKLGEPTSIKKDSYTELYAYRFLDNTILVNADVNLIVCAFEVCHPMSVLFKDKVIMPCRYDEVRKYVEQFDNDLEFDGAGFTSYKLNIGVFSPSAEKSPTDPVLSVITFLDGYYD